ncbi:MAG: hypothetical protein HY271_18060 [Deltaproteobacteria bacterium]|nr:hypothetical protein [Deltaproteobacteria bacterium]
MIGSVIWPAAIVAFGADLLTDLAFGNPAVNGITFGIVFVSVAFVRFFKRADGTEPTGVVSRAKSFIQLGRQMAEWRGKYPQAWDWGERCAASMFEEIKGRPGTMPSSQGQISELVRTLYPGVGAAAMQRAAERQVQFPTDLYTAVCVAFGTKLTDLLTDALQNAKHGYADSIVDVVCSAGCDQADSSEFDRWMKAEAVLCQHDPVAQGVSGIECASEGLAHGTSADPELVQALREKRGY